MDEESKHMIIVKGFIIAKQQQFRKINLIKAIKLELKLDQREPLQVDEEATKRFRQMKLSNITVDEDKALQTFGIANRIDKIIQEAHLQLPLFSSMHCHNPYQKKKKMIIYRRIDNPFIMNYET